MKILFVENRAKTLFWEQVALSLQKMGHQVDWLVQNPHYRPRQIGSTSEVYVLPFPVSTGCEPATYTEAWIREFHPAVVTDRGRNFFGAGATHYDHYKAEISRVLSVQCPDLVIGESTLFHELLTIDLCRAAGITYVQPMSNRYPQGRFSLLAFDTQLILIESGNVWPEKDARELAERIATGTEIPFYMRAPSRAEKMQRHLAGMLAHGNVWWARLRGERYNTPSLRRKFALGRQLKRNMRRWRALQNLPSNPQATLLYPMQLQPEANIDVWGRPYSDQLAIIREMLAAAPPHFQVAVKANPKAKYELTAALFALAESDSRVCLLPLELGMPAALACSIGAVTVTGTVGFEAICGKGRAISLRHPIIEQEFPEFHAATPADAVCRLLTEPLAGFGNVSTGTKLIQLLVSQSFPGLVGDPLFYPRCIEPANVEAVAQAICRLIETRP